MSIVKTISCLPNAGIENPYQFLMIKGLNKSNNIEAIAGIDNKFYGLLMTVIKQKPDFLHLDWIASYYYRKNSILTLMSLPIFVFQILFIKNFTKTKIVWTLHNVLPHDLPMRSIHLFCQRFLSKNSYFIRVFAESTVDKVVQMLGIDRGKIKVVPEGSYVEYYKNGFSKFEARNKLNLSENSKVLLYIGLIKPYKGILELITILQKEEKFQKIKLVIAGKSMDAQYFKSIQNEIKSKLIILHEGFVNENELQVYFNAADAVILPFKNIENSGSAIMAMGFKKPIIAPRKGVLISRLENQPELLFENLEEGLLAFEKMSQNDLARLGELNFENLKKYNWEDFASCF
jgi:beta-1,4-mannosyltransferase